MPPVWAYVKKYGIEVILMPIQLATFQSRGISPAQIDHPVRALLQAADAKCKMRFHGAHPGSCCVQTAPEHHRHWGFLARAEEKKEQSLKGCTCRIREEIGAAGLRKGNGIDRSWRVVQITCERQSDGDKEELAWARRELVQLFSMQLV